MKKPQITITLTGLPLWVSNLITFTDTYSVTTVPSTSVHFIIKEAGGQISSQTNSGFQFTVLLERVEWGSDFLLQPSEWKRFSKI